MLESDDDNSGTLDFEEFKVPPGRISGFLSRATSGCHQGGPEEAEEQGAGGGRLMFAGG